jgi:hypothetical protein
MKPAWLLLIFSESLIGASFVLAHYTVQRGLLVVWQGGFGRDGYVPACSSDRKNHPAPEGRKFTKQFKNLAFVRFALLWLAARYSFLHFGVPSLPF